MGLGSFGTPGVRHGAECPQGARGPLSTGTELGGTRASGFRGDQGPRSRWFASPRGANRKRVSGFCERFVGNRGVGRAPPEMRSRNPVPGPRTRDVLLRFGGVLFLFRDMFLILIVARGCKKRGLRGGWRWADGALFCWGKRKLGGLVIGDRGLFGFWEESHAVIANDGRERRFSVLIRRHHGRLTALVACAFIVNLTAKTPILMAHCREL